MSLLTLPPLDNTSYNEIRIDPRATERLEQEVRALHTDVLRAALTEEHPHEDHLNLPLILAQRVLLHGWCDGPGQREADCIQRIFRVLSERLTPQSILLESSSTSLWGLLFMQLRNYQFPYPESAHDNAAPSGAGGLGFALIFAPSCATSEQKYVTTYPERFGALVSLLEELGSRLPTTIKRTLGSHLMDVSLEDKRLWMRDLNHASQAVMEPFARRVKQQALHNAWPAFHQESLKPSQQRERL